jgi:hypothetical protein
MLCKGAKEKNWNPALKGTERMLAIYDYTTFGMVSFFNSLLTFLIRYSSWGNLLNDVRTFYSTLIPQELQFYKDSFHQLSL